MTEAPPRPVVLAGGPIVTMAEPARVEAVAVRDGRILHAGTLVDCRAAAGRDVQERDLGGSTLIPGFVDPHIHPLMYGQTASWIDVGPAVAGSVPEMVAALAARVAQVPSDVPVRGYG